MRFVDVQALVQAMENISLRDVARAEVRIFKLRPKIVTR